MIDSHEVTLAVQDRSIPKLCAALTAEGISSDRQLSALRTLTELMSHQEMKDAMIDTGVLAAAATLSMHEDPEIVTQACVVMGGILQSLKARKILEETQGLEGLRRALTHDN